ncbi:MAG TPA: hypothetical protein VF292_02885 [Rhodanobacteraceae bacterium]
MSADGALPSTADDTPRQGTLDLVPTHPHMATTTVMLPRLNIFQPTFHPVYRDTGWIGPETARCRVRGCLGQRHEAVLEAIMHNASHVRVVTGPDGCVDVAEITADPAAIRRALSAHGESYGHSKLVGLLDDLAHTLVSVDYTRKGVRYQATGSLLADFVLRTRTGDKLWNPVTRENDRSAWTFRLGRTFIYLYGNDIPRFWDPGQFRPLTTGIAQAVARYVLAHANNPIGGWKLDTLIHAVLPGDITTVTLRHRRRELRLAAPALKTLGVLLENDRVRKA